MTTAGTAETTYRPARRLDLAATLRPLRHGPRDPAVLLGPAGGWLAFHTPRGSATLVLAQREDGSVEARAWGDGADWAIASVPDLCGASDDVDGFDPSLHPFVREASRRFAGLHLVRSNRVLDALVPSVFEQEVTALEALAGWHGVITAYGTPAPGERTPARLRVPLSPSGWGRVPSWAFRSAGITQRRWELVRRAAEVAPALERTLRLGRGGAEVERVLRTLPGVGVWTAALTMQRAHGDPDSPAYGDAHVSRAVCWALAGELLDAGRADLRMAELLAPWTGHRERVVRLVLATGVSAPRRGPRASVPEHRTWT